MDVEAVQVRARDEPLHLVGDLLRGTDHGERVGSSVPADDGKQVPHGGLPGALLDELAEEASRSPAGVVGGPLDLAQRRVRMVTGQVKTVKPVLHGAVRGVLSGLVLCLLAGAADDEAEVVEDLHVVRRPAVLDGHPADPGDVAGDLFNRRGGQEHGLRVLPGQELASGRSRRQEDDRGALRRRLGQVGPGDPEVPARVVDVVHLRRVSEDCPLPVAHGSLAGTWCASRRASALSPGADS